MNKLLTSKDKNYFFIESHTFTIGKACVSCNGKGYINFNAGGFGSCAYCCDGIRWRPVSERLFKAAKKKHNVR